MDIGNLTVTAAGSAMSSVMGKLFDTLQSKIANNGRDTKCKFYYSGPGAGGLIRQVAANIVGGVVQDLKGELMNEFNSLLSGKKNKSIDGVKWVQSEVEQHDKEEAKYGKLDGILALDEWGDASLDAIMLSIDLEDAITQTQDRVQYGSELVDAKKGIYKEKTPVRKTTSVTHAKLVWYDTTALITVNSDKNLIVTRVQGRDYSRKELASNGDIKFSVSGHITSGKADVYPAEEIKKFIKVMTYKGIVKINNQILDQFNVSHIVITDFSITPREGYKSLQDYTFNAIGLQPAEEVKITEDTVSVIPQEEYKPIDANDSEWVAMLKNQLAGLTAMAGDLVSQGAALASGALDNAIRKS